MKNKYHLFINLINILILSLISSFLYNYLIINAILNSKDIYLKRDLIHMNYLSVLIVVIIVYMLYAFLYWLYPKPVKPIIKSLFFGLLNFLIIWFLLSLYQYGPMNLLHTLSNPVKSVPFFSFVPIGFLIPITEVLITKCFNFLEVKK